MEHWRQIGLTSFSPLFFLLLGSWIKTRLCYKYPVHFIEQDLLCLPVKHNVLQLPCYLFSSLVETFPEYREIRIKNIFYRPSNSNTIQLFIAIKGNFSIPDRLVDKSSNLFICVSVK